MFVRHREAENADRMGEKRRYGQLGGKPTSWAVHGDAIAHRSMTLPAFFSIARNLMDSANV